MGCSVGLKYAKNALAAGARPRTSLGDTPSPFPTPRRLDSRAFGASILVPWKPGAPAALELAIRSWALALGVVALLTSLVKTRPRYDP